MTTHESIRMQAILNGLQAKLEGNLRGNRAAVMHPGARGESSEEDWLHVLKDHLPHRYQADRAFVIDSRGNCSDQIDIVIYDRQYSPYLYNQTNQRFIPAESVYGLLEVKQDMSRDHIVYAGAKAASVRRLFRTTAPIPFADGHYQPRPLPRILAGIVAYQSSWNPPFGEPLGVALSGLQVDEQIDIGCALINGAFETEYMANRTVNLSVAGPERSLVQFLFRLLKRLQALATAPAIDYQAYIEQFEE